MGKMKDFHLKYEEEKWLCEEAIKAATKLKKLVSYAESDRDKLIAVIRAINTVLEVGWIDV